jgi:hypothetical protein
VVAPVSDLERFSFIPHNSQILAEQVFCYTLSP